MTSTIARTARELLELERTWSACGLTAQQEDRWVTLVKSLLHDLKGDEDRRLNLRIPTDGEVLITRGAIKRRCKLLDLSRGGLYIKGDLRRELGVGKLVQLVRVVAPSRTDDADAEEQSVPVNLDLTCRIMWKRGRWYAGLKVVDTEPLRRRRLYAAAYYPSYLNYLTELGAADAASAA